MTSRPSAGIILAALSALLLAGCATVDLAAVVPGDPKALDAAHTPAQPKPAAPQLASADATVAAQASAAPPLVAAAPAMGREPQIVQALGELERGDAQKAERQLSALAATGAPDWRILSGLGVAASTLGRQAEAQSHFKKALQLSPANQTILNNLAMSYLLDRKPAEAEATLKRATATGRATRETLDNLALARTLKAQIEGRAAE